MLEESMSLANNSGRLLRQEEKDLVRALVKQTKGYSEIIKSLDSIVVRELSDGGMGSVRIVPLDKNEKRIAVPLATANYMDDDKILISVQINCDQTGRLFEIDLWKTDFSPIIHYPNSDSRI